MPRRGPSFHYHALVKGESAEPSFVCGLMILLRTPGGKGLLLASLGIPAALPLVVLLLLLLGVTRESPSPEGPFTLEGASG